ncbi:MAG: formate dehydrogenase accessory sulfurtransferase FdhD [Saprospiraceae bacterium]|nr:formate dehydrogenase accessory sulfurtransferase FdhD [Saprospiraceae bacterium]
MPSTYSGDPISQSTALVQVVRADAFGTSRQEDCLAVEEPLEISIAYGPASMRQRRRIAVTMRTPGHDFDLATGFLFTEGIIGHAGDVVAIRYAGASGQSAYANELIVELKSDISIDMDRLSRHFYTASSCGVCGKASLELVQTTACYALRREHPSLLISQLLQMPEKLNAEQSVFATTGGLHAAALFDPEGQLLDAKEDVGRHNALDKLIGAALKKEALPLSNHIVMVSGRASFELVQKALMAGIPVLAAVGAPSSLAVDLAAESGMTLIGFLRDGRCNVYTAPERLK